MKCAGLPPAPAAAPAVSPVLVTVPRPNPPRREHSTAPSRVHFSRTRQGKAGSRSRIAIGHVRTPPPFPLFSSATGASHKAVSVRAGTCHQYVTGRRRRAPGPAGTYASAAAHTRYDTGAPDTGRHVSSASWVCRSPGVRRWAPGIFHSIGQLS